MPRPLIILLLIALTLTACVRASTAAPTPRPYDPFVNNGGSGGGGDPAFIPTNEFGTPMPFATVGEMPFLVPTAVPLDQLLPTPRPAGMPMQMPTPDNLRILPTPRRDAEEYVVQPGDTLGSIAARYGISLEALMQANRLSDANVLEVGVTLTIPAPDPGASGPLFKIIPDSELVYGPGSARFDMAEFIKSKGGFLAAYTEQVGDSVLTAAQVITRVAQNYSINPHLLLALIEHRSGWLTNPTPAQVDFALNIPDSTRPGLYKQLTYAANQLNRGYYLWRANAVSSWVLADGSVVPIEAGINAGTAGVQNFFAQIDGRAEWDNDVNSFGLFQTYLFLFGNPFDLAVEPIVPEWLHQPRMILPFERGVAWAFTGGPHGGWDYGSAWAALDFAPISEVRGCFSADAWVVAMTDGLIIRTGEGQVIQDLDGDGYEQTGWVILYMHVESRDRVQPGTYVHGGDRIGHPSCEGGVSNATHVHVARRYNGEWIPADGPLPFVLDGWTSSGTGVEYDGYLKRGDVTLEAIDGISDLNTIQR